MRKDVGAIVVAVCLLATVQVFAQAKPDFSGTWVIDTAKGSPADSSSGLGGLLSSLTLSVKQTETTLTVEDKTASGGPESTTIYKLDGSESTHRRPIPGSTETLVLVYHSVWEGNKLVTTITQPGVAGSLYKETLYLDEKELVQETVPGDSAASQIIAPPEGAKLKLYFRRGEGGDR